MSRLRDENERITHKSHIVIAHDDIYARCGPLYTGRKKERRKEPYVFG